MMPTMTAVAIVPSAAPARYLRWACVRANARYLSSRSARCAAILPEVLAELLGRGAVAVARVHRELDPHTGDERRQEVEQPVQADPAIARVMLQVEADPFLERPQSRTKRGRVRRVVVQGVEPDLVVQGVVGHQGRARGELVGVERSFHAFVLLLERMARVLVHRDAIGSLLIRQARFVLRVERGELLGEGDLAAFDRGLDRLPRIARTAVVLHACEHLPIDQALSSAASASASTCSGGCEASMTANRSGSAAASSS
jgi:hypothetical protein